jgi:hypothetical protein
MRCGRSETMPSNHVGTAIIAGPKGVKPPPAASAGTAVTPCHSLQRAATPAPVREPQESGSPRLRPLEPHYDVTPTPRRLSLTPMPHPAPHEPGAHGAPPSPPAHRCCRRGAAQRAPLVPPVPHQLQTFAGPACPLQEHASPDAATRRCPARANGKRISDAPHAAGPPGAKYACTASPRSSSRGP